MEILPLRFGEIIVCDHDTTNMARRYLLRTNEGAAYSLLHSFCVPRFSAKKTINEMISKGTNAV
jgi:hypothetical protein